MYVLLPPRSLLPPLARTQRGACTPKQQLGYRRMWDVADVSLRWGACSAVLRFHGRTGRERAINPGVV